MVTRNGGADGQAAAHIREESAPKPQKPGDVIRIMVITLVDTRVWKCAFRENMLLIRCLCGDETHVVLRKDICILESNANKPWFHVKFTLRMNGEIYRCKAPRPSFNKLARWIGEGRW